MEITLETLATNSACFSVTNVSDQTIQFDCTYIQLDGIDYTYDGSEYGSPLLLIAAGGTREYAYVGSTLDGEIIFEIENTEYSEISSNSSFIFSPDFTLNYFKLFYRDAF